MRRLLPLLGLLVLAGTARGGLAGGQPTALVTAETLNQLIAVDLPCGRVVRRLAMPADPENVVANGSVAVVVSARGHAVTLVDVQRLRVLRVFRNFTSPHIAAITADNRYAYVTDDGAGRLVVIDLAGRRIVRSVFVGVGAHHLTINPDGDRLWIALGERASTVVVLDITTEAAPRVIARIHPAAAVHALAFTPSGTRVWLTSDSSSFVTVVDASTYRTVATIPAGSPPQHLAFVNYPGRRAAYVTSGNDGVLRILDPTTGRLIRLVNIRTGSYNVETGASFVLTSSLTRGTLTEFDEHGRLLGQCQVAPAARDAALVAR
jgi:YVTN family beta-propeller protein